MLNYTNVHSYQRWQEVEAVAGNGLHVVRDFLEAKMILASNRRDILVQNIPKQRWLGSLIPAFFCQENGK